jgi:ParB family chromosome partitioning protein
MRRDKLAGSLKALEERRAAQEVTEPPAPATAAPAVSAVAESIRKLGASAPREIDPAEITDSRFADRLDVMDGLHELIASIRRSGQQLPVLLRKAPVGAPAGKRFEVIYGRRRIAACREIGIFVRAHVAEFDDRQALVAQGLENAARLENSFIERARFAAQLDAAGYEPHDICETLNVDASGLSRMRAAVRDVPEALILAIGPAHRSGRRPWLRLGQILGGARAPHPDEARALVDGDLDSDARLARLIEVLEGSKEPRPARKPVARAQRAIGGKRLALTVDEKRMTVMVRDRRAGGFLPWLDERLEALYAEWAEEEEGN